MLQRKLVPVIALGVVAVAYILARPLLMGVVPLLGIVEFPIGALVIGSLLWSALRDPDKPSPPRPWHRHEQVVRPLPDPVAAPLLEALERWVQTGKEPEAAARVLARCMTPDEREHPQLQERLLSQMNDSTSRGARERLLREALQQPSPTPGA